MCTITPYQFYLLIGILPARIKESGSLFNLYFEDKTVCSYTKSHIINLLLKRSPLL